MGITDFFTKKQTSKTDPGEDLKKKILEAKMKKNEEKEEKKPFTSSSAKRIAKKPKKPVEKKEEKKIEPMKKPLTPEVSVFYSKDIRRVYYNYHWYFLIEDLLAQCQGATSEELFSELKNKKEYKKGYKEHVVELIVNINGQTKIVECVDDKGFMWILPMVRDDNRVFPGPFPDWLKQTSHLPAPLSQNN